MKKVGFMFGLFSVSNMKVIVHPSPFLYTTPALFRTAPPSPPIAPLPLPPYPPTPSPHPSLPPPILPPVALDCWAGDTKNYTDEQMESARFDEGVNRVFPRMKVRTEIEESRDRVG